MNKLEYYRFEKKQIDRLLKQFREENEKGTKEGGLHKALQIAFVLEAIVEIQNAEKAPWTE